MNDFIEYAFNGEQVKSMKVIDFEFPGNLESDYKPFRVETPQAVLYPVSNLGVDWVNIHSEYQASGSVKSETTRLQGRAGSKVKSSISIKCKVRTGASATGSQRVVQRFSQKLNQLRT